MKTLSLSAAAVLTLTFALPAQAQEGSIDTEIESAACAVLDEVTERMLSHLDAEDRWIEANMPAETASAEVAEAFMLRVGARNGVYDMALRFIEDFNVQCSTNVELRVQQRMCSRRPDRMEGYLREGQTCQRHREARSN